MEVITKEKDKCDESINKYFNNIFNIEDIEEIKSIIIYYENGQICEVHFEN